MVSSSVLGTQVSGQEEVEQNYMVLRLVVRFAKYYQSG